MKKWVFGCLGLLVLAGVAAGVGGYYFVYRPARDYMASFAQLKVVPQLDREVKNQEAFVAPAGGELTAAEVDRFLRVQAALRKSLGARLEELQAKYHTLQPNAGGEGHHPSFGEIMGALKDLSGLYVDAKRAQVDALNTEGFSLAEYDWARGCIYQAASIPVDTGLRDAIHALASGQKPDLSKTTNDASVVVPEKNRELVAPHVEELAQSAGLAFFGL
jgi:hypothetical protein